MPSAGLLVWTWNHPDAPVGSGLLRTSRKGKRKYYPGKIAARGDDGTYDIAYDDGEKESGVARELIRGA